MTDAPGPGRVRSRGLAPSRFTVLVPDGDGVAWFNSATGSLLRLRPDQSRALERVLAGAGHEHGGIVDELARLGFLVPAADDEFAREHRRYLDACRDRRRLLLCIAPTLACNVRCSYCFQRELQRLRRMGPELVEALLEFVRSSSDGLERLVVQWYGGEPLLALDLIREITGELLGTARAQGFGYHARMVTNGLLLERDDCWRELGELGISTLQIPLDGLPGTYARRRGIPERRAEAFYAFLLRRVEDILAVVEQVTIRINVDRDNVDEACQVVDLFAASGATGGRLEFRLGRLQTTPGMSACIPHDCLGPHEFLDEDERFRRHLADRGYRPADRPGPLGWPCGAPLDTYFSIDAAGRIGTCIPATGGTRATFAALHPGAPATTLDEIRSTPRPFGDLDPFEADGCRECPLLPSCLGSCPEHRAGEDPQRPGAVPCPVRRELESRIRSFSHR